MPDVSNTQFNANTGTVSPATPGSLTTVAGNLLFLIVGVIGTSPTITTPASYTQIQKAENASISFGAYFRANGPGGAANPSVTLGGTVTGWYALLAEFSQTGANCALQGSAISNNGALTQLPNVFSTQSGLRTIPNLLFVSAAARPQASTLTWQNSLLAGLNSGETWFADPFAQVQSNGIGINFSWGSNLAKGPGSWPISQGVLSSSGVSVQIGAWFNTTASQPSVGSNIGGNEGIYVPTFFQGMVGG